MTNQSPARPPELALPVASLAAIRVALAEAVGADAAAAALQRAGVAAGDAFYRLLAHSPAGTFSDPAGWSDGTFWRRFADLFERRGWGRIVNETPHPGVGVLNAFDWVESDPERNVGRPSCYFSAGLLANLLGRISDDEVAVLEIDCRSRGQDRCRFLYGAPGTLDTVYGQLLAGEAVETALAGLS